MTCQFENGEFGCLKYLKEVSGNALPFPYSKPAGEQCDRDTRCRARSMKCAIIEIGSLSEIGVSFPFDRKDRLIPETIIKQPSFINHVYSPICLVKNPYKSWLSSIIVSIVSPPPFDRVTSQLQQVFLRQDQPQKRRKQRGNQTWQLEIHGNPWKSTIYKWRS